MANLLTDYALDESGATLSAGPYFAAGVIAFNPGGAVAFLQLFEDAIGDVTVGTTVPYVSLPVPPGTTVVMPVGRKFAELSAAATDSATGAGAASLHLVLSDYE